MLGSAVLVLIVMVLFRVPISLDRLREPVMVAARDRLDREVAIEGGVSLVLGFPLVLEVRGFRIANPEGWVGGGDLARIGLLQARVGLGEFLDGRLDIRKLMVEGMILSLEKDAQGNKNWQFSGAREAKPSMGEGGMRIVGFDKLAVRDLSITVRNAKRDRDLSLKFEEVKGSAKPGAPVTFDLSGAIQRVPFVVSVTGDAMGDLLEAARPWEFKMDVKLEGVTGKFSGVLAGKGSGQVSSIDFGVDVDDFGGLKALEEAIPDFGTAQLRGTVEAHETGHRIPNFLGTLGPHQLSGSLSIDLSKSVPAIDGTLSLPELDISIPGREAGMGEGEMAAADGGAGGESSGNPDLPVTGTLKVSIGKVLGAPLALENLDVGLTMAARSVDGNVRVGVGGDMFGGKLAYERKSREEQDWSLRLAGSDVDVGQLVDAFVSLGLRGRAEGLKLLMEGQGKDMSSLWRDRTMSVEAARAALRWGEGEAAPPMEAETVTLKMNVGEPLRLDATGKVGEEAATFGLVYRGGEAVWGAGEAALEMSGTMAGASVTMVRGEAAKEGGPSDAFRVGGDGTAGGGFGGIDGSIAMVGRALWNDRAIDVRGWPVGLEGSIRSRGQDGMER